MVITSNNGKPTIVFMTDLAGTGFGRVGKELVSRFAKTGRFNIVYLGWACRANLDVYLEWKELGVVIEPAALSHEDQFGQRTLPKVIEKYRPQIVWTLGDPWMVEHVQRMPHRETFKWVSYVPIDRDYLPEAWMPSLKNPDVLVLYSKFGQNVVRRLLPRVKTEMIYHGVDTDVFKPMGPVESRKKMGIHPSTFIVGMVARNQIRKRIPRLMLAFKAWNCRTNIENRDVKVGEEHVPAEHFCQNVQKWRCELCPHFEQKSEYFNSGLYLHTTQGYTDQNDGLWVGWHLEEYANRYKLNENPWGVPSRVMLPSAQQMADLKGVPDDALATAYNAMNVHVLPTCREGFGLPVLEAMACGIPSIVTRYSSVIELCDDGRGLFSDVECFDEEPFWDAPSAIVSIKSLSKNIDAVPALCESGEWQEMQKRCRNFALKYQWRTVFRDWMKLFNELLS